MMLGTVTVSIWTGSGWAALNMADEIAGRAGNPSVVDEIAIHRSVTGPAGNDEASEVSVSVLSDSPTAYSRGTPVRITAIYDPASTGPTKTVASLTVESDVVVRSSASKWLHRMAFRDAVASAAQLKTTINLPVQSFDDRATWLNATYPAIFALTGDVTAGSLVRLAAVPAGTDLLTLGRAMCIAASGRLALRDGHLTDAPFPAPTGWVWWRPSARTYAEPRRVPAAALTEAAATTSAAAHISTVTISHSDGAGGSTETSITDGDTYQSVRLETALAGGLDISLGAMDRLEALATAIVHAPVEPVLDAVRVLDLGGGNELLTGPVGEDFNYGLVDIQPTPQQAGRFHIITGADARIGHGRQLALTWQLTPDRKSVV